MGDDHGHQFLRQFSRGWVPLHLGQVALQDRLGGSLTEVGFEDRGER